MGGGGGQKERAKVLCITLTFEKDTIVYNDIAILYIH